MDRVDRRSAQARPVTGLPEQKMVGLEGRAPSAANRYVKYPNKVLRATLAQPRGRGRPGGPVGPQSRGRYTVGALGACAARCSYRGCESPAACDGLARPFG